MMFTAECAFEEMFEKWSVIGEYVDVSNWVWRLPFLTCSIYECHNF